MVLPAMNLHVEVLSDAKLQLAWIASAAPRLDHYLVYGSKSQNVDANNPRNYKGRLEATARFFIDSGLEKNTSWYYLLGAYDENGMLLQMSNVAAGTTANSSFEKKVVIGSLVLAGILFVASTITIWTYAPGNYLITFDGELIFNDENLSAVIDNQQSSLIKIINMHGFPSDSYIFSSPLSDKFGRVINSQDVSFNGDVIHSLGNSLENQWTTVNVSLKDGSLKAGLYDGSFIIEGESIYSIPVAIETPPLLYSAIMLVMGGVALSVAMWEGIKYFKNSMDHTEARILEAESGRATARADQELKLYNSVLKEQRIRGLNDAKKSALISEQNIRFNKFLDLRVEAEIKQRASAEAHNKLGRYTARVSKGIPVAAKIGIIELATAGIGITIALIAILNNDLLSGLRVINMSDALILVGLGLGIGSLKEFIDK